MMDDDAQYPEFADIDLPPPSAVACPRCGHVPGRAQRLAVRRIIVWTFGFCLFSFAAGMIVQRLLLLA